MNTPKITDLLELRKDISSPSMYRRAGFIQTAQLWLIEFPGCLELMWKEWFINLSEVPAPSQSDPIRDTVMRVFEKHGLKSLSYIDAACEAAKEIVKEKEA